MLRENFTYDNVTTTFDRGFTGHEHLYNFGLINMNGRVYDPYMSTFLSPDNYMQDPTSQQGFNRYAYCMYNPLKYVDPSGYRYFGYDESAYYRMLEEATQRVFREWYSVYDMAVSLDMDRILTSVAVDIFREGDKKGKFTSPQPTVNVANLKTGVYVIKVKLTDGNNYVAKIVKE